MNAPKSERWMCSSLDFKVGLVSDWNLLFSFSLSQALVNLGGKATVPFGYEERPQELCSAFIFRILPVNETNQERQNKILHSEEEISIKKMRTKIEKRGSLFFSFHSQTHGLFKPFFLLWNLTIFISFCLLLACNL